VCRRRFLVLCAQGQRVRGNVAGTLRVPSALLGALRTGRGRRHTECACYVVNAHGVCRLQYRFVAGRALPIPRRIGRLSWIILQSTAKSNTAANVAGTLRVPSALLGALRTGRGRRHTECACYVVNAHGVCRLQYRFVAGRALPIPRRIGRLSWSFCNPRRKAIRLPERSRQRSRHTPCAVGASRCSAHRAGQTAHGVCLLRCQRTRSVPTAIQIRRRAPSWPPELAMNLPPLVLVQ
jgi:hypothetical protein